MKGSNKSIQCIASDQITIYYEQHNVNSVMHESNFILKGNVT